MRGKNLWAICLALLTLMGSGVPVNAAETDIAENELCRKWFLMSAEKVKDSIVKEKLK